MRTLRAIPAALAKGFSEWQTLLVLLSLTLVSAGIAVLPDLGTLLRFYGHAPLADGRPLLSYELLLGLRRAFPLGGGALRTLPVALLTSVPLTLFVTGGVVWRAWTVDRFRLVEFITECARVFGRMVRTLLWSLPLLAVCWGAVAGAAELLHRLHRDSLFTRSFLFWGLERPLTGWAMAHLVFLGVLWALWRLTLDTSRVLVHVEDLKQTRRAVWRAFRLAIGSPGAWAGYLLLGAAELVAVFLAMRIHVSLPEGNTALAWLGLLVAQGVVLVRAGFQVSTTAYAASLVRRRRAADAPAEAAAPADAWRGGGGLVEPAPLPTAAALAAAQASVPAQEPAEGEPFELLTSPSPPKSSSSSDMPLVDADLVEDEPKGGGTGKR